MLWNFLLQTLNIKTILISIKKFTFLSSKTFLDLFIFLYLQIYIYFDNFSALEFRFLFVKSWHLIPTSSLDYFICETMEDFCSSVCKNNKSYETLRKSSVEQCAIRESKWLLSSLISLRCLELICFWHLKTLQMTDFSIFFL